MALDVRLDDGKTSPGDALFDNLAAQAPLQDIIRPPQDREAVFVALEELLRQAASLHAIQGGHLVQQSGALLF